jgi:hypothetical protein
MDQLRKSLPFAYLYSHRSKTRVAAWKNGLAYSDVQDFDVCLLVLSARRLGTGRDDLQIE